MSTELRNEPAQEETSAVEETIDTGVSTLPVGTVSVSKAEMKLQKRLEREKRRGGRKRFPIKRTIFGLLTVGLVGVGLLSAIKNAGQPMLVKTVNVVKGDLVQSVNLTGTLYSADEKQIYAKAAGKVVEVNVKVGDWIEEGETLARLDTTELELSIAKLRASIARSAARTDLTLQQTEEKLNDAKVDVAAGLNQSLLDAQHNVDTALRNLFEAQDNFYEARDNIENGEILLENAASERDRAARGHDDAKRALEEYKIQNPEDTSSDTFKRKETAVRTAYNDLLVATERWDALHRQYGEDLSEESLALRTARENYQRALDNKRIAEQLVERNLKSMEYELASTRLSDTTDIDQMELASLEQQMADSVIVSPISGMVTAVYAQEGVNASGVLFVVEDTKRLQVKTQVKGFDLDSVKEGQEALITTDSTGDKTFAGKVKMIYPTAAKTADGQTQSNTGAAFDTEIDLLEHDDALRVGLSVQATVITQEKKDVLYVPFDAVQTTADGENQVFVFEDGENGEKIVKAKPVSVGMETDFYLEITGEGIAEGISIAADPSGLTEGMAVRTENPGSQLDAGQ